MTVASEITRIKTNISNAYDSAEAKGATLPEQKNSENLAECIDSITGGGSKPNERLLIRLPDGVMTSSNAPRVTNVYSTGGVKGDFGGCTKFDCNYLYDLFAFRPTQENFVFSAGELKEIVNTDVQRLCYNLNFASGYTDIWFDNLEKINSFFGDLFLSTNITSLHFPKLYDCTGAWIQKLNAGQLYLDSVKSTSFLNASIEFLFSGLSNQTVHFPSNMASIIPTLSGYPNFSGTNTTILYDLPATE